MTPGDPDGLLDCRLINRPLPNRDRSDTQIEVLRSDHVYSGRKVHLVAGKQRRRLPRVAWKEGREPFAADSGPARPRNPWLPRWRRMVRRPSQGPSAARWSRRPPQEASGSSGGEKRDPEGQDHAHGRSDKKQPPSPSLPCLRKQKAGVASQRLVPEVVGRGRPRLSQSNWHRTTMTSTMISVNVDRSDPLVLHDQVAAEIPRPSPTGRRGRETASRWSRTSPPSSGSARTPCCGRCTFSGTRGSWNSPAAGASRSWAHHSRSRCLDAYANWSSSRAVRRTSARSSST